MIVIMGFIKTAAGEADRLQPVLSTMMAESEKEDGCIRYVFSRVVNDPDEIVISELWRDQAALAAHFKTPHMASFNAAIAGAKILHVSVKQYDGTCAVTLMGAD
jgi:quinol monooxygenase YgiN